MKETRNCSNCKREFPNTKEFFFCDKNKKDGLKSQCKECESDKEIFGLPKGQFNINWKSLDSKSGIYKISNLINGKIYIGSAVNLCMRLSCHLHKLTNNEHENEYLQNSFNKHGKSSFKFEIIELVYNKNDLLINEQYWLDKTQCYNRGIGYNILKIAGNSLGNIVKEETKEKLRRISNKPIIQLSLNGEFIKEWLSGNEVERVVGYKSNNISLCLNNKSKQSNGFIWVFKDVYCSNDFNLAEYKNKKTLLQYSKKGVFIKEWDALISEVSRKLKIKDSNISQCCLSKQPSAGGYIWRFRHNDEIFDNKILPIVPRVKMIGQYTSQNGMLALLKTWENALTIEKELHIDRKSIAKCCNGDRQEYKGYVWKYVI